MERWCRRRPATLHRGVSPYCRSHARGRGRQLAMGLARELARSTGAKMEPFRKLFPRRKLLRLGRAQRLRASYTDDARWNRKLALQVAQILPAFDQACAGQANDYRGVRMRFA